MVHSIILVVAYVVMRGAVNLEKWMQVPSTNLRALRMKVVRLICNQEDWEHYPEGPFEHITQSGRVLL